VSKLVKAFIFFSLFSTLGCTADKKMSYEASDISNISYNIDEKKLVLTYSPLLETLYYSPGIDLLVSENALIVKVIRCKIKSLCEVDIKAKPELGFTNNITINLKKSYTASQIFINEPNKENSLKVLSGS